jgi:hypothetical protein
MTGSPGKPSGRLIGVKLFVIAASLAGTLGGWTVLAIEHARASAAPPSAAQAPGVQIISNGSSQNPAFDNLRPATGTSRPHARTRSSR